MSKANYSRRAKLLYNIFRSNLSPSDKMIYYCMHQKYLDGVQLLQFIETHPTEEKLIEYIESRLRENKVEKGNGTKEANDGT